MLFDPKWKTAEITIEPWRQVMLDAADILECDGWIRGAYQKPEGYCAIGALRKASGVPHISNHHNFDGTTLKQHFPAYAHACYVLELKLSSGIGCWNDSRLRTKTEVVAKLREVANAV
jgi:hypothetical protein